MNIKILGCHGSDALTREGSTEHCCRSIGFLVNNSLMIDAGTVSSALNLESQKQIRHIVLTHAHMDHLKELPSLADNLISYTTNPITIASIPPVLQDLKSHIFNDVIFPNFFALPNPTHPILHSETLQEEQASQLGEVWVTPIPVNHVVPTVGLIFKDEHVAWALSGDTHQTEAIWEAIKREPNLKAVFIETSFPNEMSDLALASKHLTPNLLLQEFQKIGKPNLPLYIYHLKPPFQDQITTQLKQLGIPNLHILTEGQEIEIS
jgi:ribonuclease BN (tRNA processing enzyme)